MKRQSLRIPALLACAVLFASSSVSAQTPQKPTLAIADVAISPGGWTLPPPQLSGSIVERMVNELVSSDRFHVYDGQWLVPDAETGGRVNLPRLRAAAAASHVDYIVLGNVTAFTSEHKQRRMGGLIPR